MNPKIIMELDTGNAIEGGADPVRICSSIQDRRIFLHCKPYSRKNGFDVMLGDKRDDNRWEQIALQAREKCEWFIIESESNVADELENAQKCIDNLKIRLNL